MGCGQSRTKKAEDKKIDFEFPETGIPQADEFFKSAHDALEKAEEIREGLEDSRDEAVASTHVDLLQDAKYTDVVQVLLWSISAQNGGKVKDAQVGTKTEAPYITIDATKAKGPTHELYENFVKYITTSVSAAPGVKEITEKFADMVKKAPEIISGGKDYIKESSKDPIAKGKSVATLTKNAHKLTKQAVKIEGLTTALKQAGIDIKELVPKLKELVDTADETGAKAVKDKLTDPGDLFDKYHTGVRKPKDEGEKKDEHKKDDHKKDDHKKDEHKKDEKAGEKKDEKAGEKKDEKAGEKKDEQKPAEKKTN